jgi:hypothetical protein
MSEETKAKISQIKMGHPVSEETRMKISSSNKGKHGLIGVQNAA